MEATVLSDAATDPPHSSKSSDYGSDYATAQTTATSITIPKSEGNWDNSRQGRQNRLYHDLVKWRFNEIQPGERNKAAVDMAAFLFHAVIPSLALKFAERFYGGYADIFNDPLETHLAETRHVLDGCARSYPVKLNGREQEVYKCLDEEEQAAFRICRSLSRLESQKAQGTFGMAEGHLSDRLDSYNQKGRTVLQALLNAGAITVVEKGIAHRPGERGKQTSYRWALGTTDP